MSYYKVDFEEAKELIDHCPDLIILDVREEEEYITGHAVNAALLTLDDIDEYSAKAVIPDKNTPLLLYCRTGRRSKEAADKLEALGYNKIYDVGGLIGWPFGLE